MGKENDFSPSMEQSVLQSLDRASSNKNGRDAMIVHMSGGEQFNARTFSREVRAVLARYQVNDFDLEFRHFGTGHKVASLSEVREGVHPYLVKKSNGDHS